MSAEHARHPSFLRDRTLLKQGSARGGDSLGWWHCGEVAVDFALTNEAHFTKFNKQKNVLWKRVGGACRKPQFCAIRRLIKPERARGLKKQL